MPLANRNSPLLSVITVVFNNVRDIERTVLSITGQTYASQIEYIVIDGASTDGTMAILEQYSSKIDVLISEPDEGIYDAMNKGLQLARGEYVLFMNSGDEIYVPETVERIFSRFKGADIYYGETEMINARGESLGRRRHHAPLVFNWKSFRYGMNVSHQAIYIRKSITAPFDRKYELSSDIDWIIRAAKKARIFSYNSDYVARYLIGGMSKKRHLKSLKERFNIFTHHYGLLNNLINHVVIAYNLVRYFLRNGRTND